MAPNGLGPALGEWVIAWGGFVPFFLVATAWALVSLLLVAGMREEPRPTHHEPHAGAREAVRLVRRGGLAPLLAATLLFGAGINAAYYFVAPFTRAVGIEHAAPFFAAYATTTIVLRVFGRQLPDRLGAYPVALPAFAVFATGLATLSLLPVPGALVLAGIACGAGHGTLFPVLNALAVSRTPARLQGVVVSLYTGALDAGAVLGTPLCGAVARTSYRAMFLMMALASLVGLALLALDRRRSGAAALRRAAAVVLVAALMRPALAAEWPQLSSGPLEDNSFLIAAVTAAAREERRW
jgi:predicted MFS family arabinose efflux permease